MPTGVSPLQYPEQPTLPEAMALDLDNSYFLVKLHDAQAYFEAGWLVQPGVFLACFWQLSFCGSSGIRKEPYRKHLARSFLLQMAKSLMSPRCS